MATIHNEIENWLAADLHGDLSESEQSALHAHLVDCAACRKTHHETKTMNKILEETLAHEKPDPAFERRMLAGFRNRIPERTGVSKVLANLMRLRATQITAVAAVLLGLVQIGRMLTGENAAPLPSRENYTSEGFVAQPPQAGATGADQSTSLAKSDELTRGQSQDLAPNEPPPPAAPASRSELDKEAAARPMGLAAAKVAAATPQNLARAEQAEAKPGETPAPAQANRKLIRNATVQLEIVSFDDAVQKITALANEERGYVATTSSEKQANGKLRGTVIVKVLPENLDRFLQKVRGLGELKNQTLGTEDVTKAYLDTDARLKNAHVMEQRLVDMLKTKTGKVSDLLQVEKELGRVREDIEKMQGELKYWDSQVQFVDLRTRRGENLQRYQDACVAEGADHERAVEPRLFRTRLRDNEHVDRARGQRRCHWPRERIGARGELSNANAAHRAGRQRHVGQCEDQTRQGGTQHHHLARGTGAGFSTNQSAHSHRVSGRKGKGAWSPRRETRWTRSQLNF